MDVVVVDPGSGSFKVGIGARHSVPAVVVPTIVGKPTSKEDGPQSKNSFIGEEALRNREFLTLKHPVERGMITDWEGFEEVLKYSIDKLSVNNGDFAMLIAEAPPRTSMRREKMTELMFETFCTPLATMQQQAVLSLYNSGATTGIVIDSGEGVTHVVPIYEGYALHCGTLRLDVAGGDLTQCVEEALKQRGYSIPYPRETIRSLKEKLNAYASLDFIADSIAVNTTTSVSDLLELPDGQIIDVRKERISIPEVMFRPSLANINCSGMHELVKDSILKCDVDIRSSLLAHVLLSGGNTMFQFFGERLVKELSMLFPDCGDIKVVAPPDRLYSSWIGGAAFSNLSIFEQLAITKSEYEEFGSRIVHNKCF